MAIVWDLAMTAAEFYNYGEQVAHVAWMACHFSPYGLGLSNLPTALPKGSVLMVDDCTPPRGHDPAFIAKQLQQVTQALQCSCVLLDFQRPNLPENRRIAEAAIAGLELPVGVSSLYADTLLCPVFLPPVPLHIPVEEYVAPWRGREIWLEAALDGECITVTEMGAEFLPPVPSPGQSSLHHDANLCCHYTTTVSHQKIQFSLHRTREDLKQLILRAETAGISRAMGLYQELKE